ncbi:4-(cytidine 5'-diphospho)-2-C-methyl-D-erythritol kinase [Clostridium felsineum]|uniref:4-diphosphocytidyl-2-C-methyl-D-erythritol kinase n=1 Tax=Clostridium felsineum TaxID=36839 RepID=A0A1S8KX47_9CLOT|nr:4-(cytidine 5'-diphospho)-2-C-methyl-D-erythritol kinase [Clostridium felsineum]MCR3758352.1 4-(cytidine 5'-diphospho)-2-C-methyl-D-erythritol kinase [Clostridium felsineum]URZ03713.1 4-diphosphocytidyl-2-C-methyl-D-erythritol kinase [Clostridium felsineum]URZ07981.1 4-diphosphocytidyl-2-C-methyl-D-erythritol kinase [Clostridium felsineum]URZ13012.1 4-diphosphocytidyl-2-C-methyl-D-erythritol kinase [Clostridium felsineum]URZ14997.1 4-diphosphocytidyl-2-C-methyl-D-erythritol kinase [Clostrid
MKVKAYAKVNISLDVIGNREDGYHLLEMIMQSINLYDVLDIKVIDEGIRITSNRRNIPINHKNIAYRAAQLFIDTYKIDKGVSIHINKRIPVAAGLAGGSADGAAVLKAMRQLFKNQITDKELIELGVKIGADVPFCIVGGTAFCEGIGEKITKLQSLKDRLIVLVKPNFGASTKIVYSEYDKCTNIIHPDSRKIIEAVNKGDFDFVVNNMVNVLENVTAVKYDEINQIKAKALEFGAQGAMMSGSGPTVFGFFDSKEKAESYFYEMKKYYKKVFITRTV